MYYLYLFAIMFNMYAFICFEKIASYKAILILRIASEILGAFRMYPIALFAKCVLDICIREPLNMCMYNGMINK